MKCCGRRATPPGCRAYTPWRLHKCRGTSVSGSPSRASARRATPDAGAEAGDELRPGWRLHEQGKGARAFGAPRNAVEVVTLDVIFDDAQMPVAIVGIVETRALCGSSPGIDFQALGKVWVIAQLLGVAAFLDPREALHAALLRLGKHLLKNIPVWMLRGATYRAEHRIAVELGMRRGIVASDPVIIVLLRAMV